MSTLVHAIEASEARRRHTHEFKFSKCGDEVRDRFFEAVRERPFSVRAIVVKKQFLRSAALTTPGRDKFYEFFLDTLVRRNIDALRGARVMIDGSSSRAFRMIMS